jgi:hypothetical protein
MFLFAHCNNNGEGSLWPLPYKKEIGMARDTEERLRSLAQRFGGEKGVLSDREIARIKRLMPSANRLKKGLKKKKKKRNRSGKSIDI